VGVTSVESVVILCGGRGTRLQEHTRSLPKPLVEIGGRPILWHVMRIYAAQGLRRFVLCTGYLGEQIESFVAGAEWPETVDVECVDTGVETPTGGRIARVRDRVGEATFCATYALATMTVVRPELQFGVTELDGDDRVTGFQEKPRSDHWINGGFFCFDTGVFDYLSESSVLEHEPLEGMAVDDQLRAFRHTGFWECMDTYKDAVQLNDLWAGEQPPWKVWA
jgi:glucose-1-phosphate cytidylyltransferase